MTNKNVDNNAEKKPKAIKSKSTRKSSPKRDIEFEELCKRNIAERQARAAQILAEREEAKRKIDEENIIIRQEYYDRFVKFYTREYAEIVHPQEMKELVLEKEANQGKEKISTIIAIVISFVIISAAIYSYIEEQYIIFGIKIFILFFYWSYLVFRAHEFEDTDKHIICPHCQVKGQVSTRKVTRKTGVSGGKAAAAIVTGGWSLLATGISRKEDQTECRCGKCKSVWYF